MTKQSGHGATYRQSIENGMHWELELENKHWELAPDGASSIRGSYAAPMLLWDDHRCSGVVRWWCSKISGSVECSGLVGSSGRRHMRHGRPRGGGDRRAMARPGPNTVAAVVLVGERRGCRRSDPLARTLWSVTAKVLRMLFSSDISSPRVGRRGSGDGATCSNHATSSVHALARPRIL